MSPAPALSSSSSTTVQEFRPKQQAVVVALRTRPFLAPEVEAAGPDGPSSGISVEGRKMSVTVPVKKVQRAIEAATRDEGKANDKWTRVFPCLSRSVEWCCPHAQGVSGRLRLWTLSVQ